MNVAQLIEWKPEHALVVHHPNGDHFFPHLATEAMRHWQSIEQEVGHTAWMSIQVRRASSRENWN